MHRLTVASLTLSSLFLTTFLQAQSLSFTEKNKTVEVKKGEDTVLVDYAFTNNSEKSVAIRKFDAPMYLPLSKGTGCIGQRLNRIHELSRQVLQELFKPNLS